MAAYRPVDTNRPRPDHPRDPLEFFLDEPDDLSIERVKAFVLSCASREWTLGPPLPIDQTDGEHRDVGGIFELYSALPPWGQKLPLDVDAAQLQETKYLLAELCRLSLETKHNFRVWFNGEEIGYVQNGKPDRSLAEGLIGEWERAVTQRGAQNGV